MSSRSLLATLGVAASLSCARSTEAGAQNTLPLKHTGKPTQSAITVDDAMARLYIFADDSMLGRALGEAGGIKATAYIEKEVRRLGLVPAGDNGTFFQALPLITQSLDLSSRLSADSESLAAGTDYLPINPGGTPRSLDGARIVFAGNSAQPEAMIPAEAAAGKVVAVTGSTAGLGRRYPAAIAFIAFRPDAGLAQARRFALTPSTRMRSADDSVATTLLIVVPASAAAKFLGVPLANARPGTAGRTLHGGVRYTVTEDGARNVIAILPGSDPALRNQYVAIGAHSDHLGLRSGGPVDADSIRAFNEIATSIYMARTKEMPDLPGTGITAEERASIRINVDSLRSIRPVRRDSVYNGADDDGSGSIGLLEVAEKFAGAKVKPKRSLIFVWHTGEEEGLFGSEFFTDHPTISRDSIVAQLNVDMIGRGEATDLPGGNPSYLQLLGSRRLSTELGDLIESVNRSYSTPFKFDYQYDAPGHPDQYYCRSDHYEYARYGIPVVFMSTGGHVDYHQVTDEPQRINYPHLVKVTSFLADIAERVANLDHRPVVDKPKPDPKGQCVQ
jgi:peptidase M28-like protein